MKLSPRHKTIATATMAVIIVAVLYIYASEDPESSRWFPRCFFHELTGLQCPSCGNQRALHALLHGHPCAALANNLFLIVMIPIAAATAITTLLPYNALSLKIKSTVISRRGLMIFVALYFAWWIIRNIAGI